MRIFRADRERAPRFESRTTTSTEATRNRIVNGASLARRLACASTALFLVSLTAVAVSQAPAGATTDTTAPAVASFSISPTSVDTSTGPKTITVTTRITDDSSGFAGATFDFQSQSGYQVVTATLGPADRISGTALDGVYQTSMTIGQYVYSGAWTFSDGYVSDVAGNENYYYLRDFVDAGFSTLFTKSGPSDTDAPVLVSFTMSPRTIDTTTGSKTIALTARITDDLSGFSSGKVYFESQQYGTLSVTFDSTNRTSGTALDGNYAVSLTVPQYAYDGYWTVYYAYFYDAIGNEQYFNYNSFESTGFPYYFYKYGPSDTTDPGLKSFTFTPTSIDTSTSAATITVTARITDDLSGFSSGWVDFDSENYDQYVEADFDTSTRISGNALDGVYQTTMTVPLGSDRGPWTVDYSDFSDGVGNSSYYGLSDFVADGFQTTFTNGAATSPSSPLNVSATAGDKSAGVSWDAPASTGGSPINSYTVTATPGGATATVSDGATNATVIGLTNGAPYTFTVMATNDIGSSPPSAPSNTVTPASVPGPPTGVTASAGNQSAQVSWTAPASNGNSIGSYTVTASPDGTTVTVPGSQTAATVTGLTNGISYTFTVFATNGVGPGLPSAASNPVTPGSTPPAVELPGTGFTVPASLGTTSIPAVEKWVAASSPSGICSYDLRESVAGGPFNEVALPNPLATSVPVTLEPTTSYRFELNVTNCLGQSSGWGVQPSFAPLVWQESNKKVKFNGTWKSQTTSSAYGGALRYSTAKGASVSETFQGTGVAWVSEMGPTLGKATVYLDGVKQKTVDLYSPTLLSRQVVWKQGYSVQTRHTIKVVVTGTKGHPRVDLDAFLTFHLQ